MSARKINKALKVKNINVESVIFDRSCPTPSGYASGYSLVFSNKVIDAVWELNHSVHIANYVELDTLEDVLNWVGTLPALAKKTKYGVV